MGSITYRSKRVLPAPTSQKVYQGKHCKTSALRGQNKLISPDNEVSSNRDEWHLLTAVILSPYKIWTETNAAKIKIIVVFLPHRAPKLILQHNFDKII